MRRLSTILLLLSFLSAVGQEQPEYSIFLMGDAGEPSIVGSPQIETMHLQMLGSPNSTALFLGDNIYPKGMPSEDHKFRTTAEAIVQGQLAVADGYEGNIFVVPGNHDWEKGNKEGAFTNAEQEAFVEVVMDSLNIYLPDDGCPGPVEVQLAEDITLILLNSQWFLHPWQKPGLDEGCQVNNLEDFLGLMEDILQRNEGKKIIVASHHPMYTYGIHGGRATFKDHLFPLTNASHNLYIPLPVIGSIYPFYRKFIGSLQDIANPVYKSYRNSLVDLLEHFPNVIHVSGHEHSLQYSSKDGVQYIVSGSGSKTTPVKKKGYAQFVTETIGFARLDFYRSGPVVLTFHDAHNNELFRKEILNSIYSPEVVQYEKLTSIPTDTVVTTQASNQYNIDSSKYWLFGANYRDVWKTEVQVPVFNIQEEKGGLTIIKRGGGMQTRSLRFEAADGRQYVTRSIEKFAEKAVPDQLQGTFASDLIQDQISASNPYGAIAVPVLADAAGVYHSNPELRFMPDDPRLGPYQEDFGNMMVLFEERPAGDRSDVTSFGAPSKVISTTKMLEGLYKDNDNKVDQRWVLKSRLFDLYIGDWDRHDDQWRWARFGEKGSYMYRPIPRDRDNAFFVNQGLIMSVVKRKWAMPKFQGFDYELKNPEGFMFNARFFDRSFLSEMDRDDWIMAADSIALSMTDEVIDEAMGVWPEPVQQQSADEIASKLRARREKLRSWALDYYDFLSKEVNVTGSNKKEFFDIERLNNDETRVRIYKSNKEGLKNKLLYDRTFLHRDTRELRLYGLKGSDVFSVRGDVSKSLKVRIIGGPGKDSIYDHSRVRGMKRHTIVYDTRNTALASGPETISKLSDNPLVNKYDRKDFKYNFMAPLVYANYNIDDGVFLGGGFMATKHGFRKEPFASQHLFLGSIAPKTASFDFQYKSRYTNVIRQLDLKLNATIQSPNYTSNFFGIGNETVFDQNIDETKNVDKAIEYYRVRYKFYSLEGFLSKDFSERINFDFGFHWQAFITEQDYEGEDRFILDYAAFTGDSSIFDFKTYQGLVLKFEIDTRNNRMLPERGLHWTTDLRGYTGLNNASNRFTSLNTTIAFYQTARLPRSLTLAVRAGLGQNYGSYEYYQGQILGGVKSLRGYRKTRFIGDRKAFTNLELRYHLANIRLLGIPSVFGLNGFFDAGRVWAEEEVSNTIHQTIGGGIWFAPLKATVLAFDVGSSPEETRLYFRLGFLF